MTNKKTKKGNKKKKSVKKIEKKQEEDKKPICTVCGKELKLFYIETWCKDCYFFLPF